MNAETPHGDLQLLGCHLRRGAFLDCLEQFLLAGGQLLLHLERGSMARDL